MALPLVVTALISGFFAGLMAILVTVAIEKFGGVVGGVIGSLPGTIIPATIGLAYQLGVGTSNYNDATSAVPVGLCVTSLFLMTWRILPKYFPAAWSFRRRLVVMLSVSLTMWMVVAMIAAVLIRDVATIGLTPFILGVSAVVLQFFIGVVGVWKPQPAPKGTKKVPKGVLAARALGAATAVFVSILLAKLDDFLAGIISVFPAVFSTTMVGLWISQGEAVPAGAVGPLALGSVSVSLYALSTQYTYSTAGIWLGAAGSYLVGAAYSLPVGIVLYNRSKTSAQPAHVLMLDDDENPHTSYPATGPPIVPEIIVTEATPQKVERKPDFVEESV